MPSSREQRLADGSDLRAGVGPTASLPTIAAVGFLATVLVVLGGSLAGAADPDGSWTLWSVPAIPVTPATDLAPALAAYYGGLIILVRAWLSLRRRHLMEPDGSGLGVWAVVAVAAIWAIPLFAGPPLGSRDVYAYAAQGRMAEQGLDVYADGPAELGPDDPVLAAVDPLYREKPAPYGPVFVSLSSLVSTIAGDRVAVAVLAFRVVAVAGIAAAAVGVHHLARSSGRDPVDAMILAVANPLVLFHLVSGAHNEAVMLGFLVTGVALGRRGGSGWLHLGIVVCAFAAAIKLPAILAVAFLGWPWAGQARSLVGRIGRLGVVGAEALLVIAAAGRLTGWGWGWVDAITNTEPVDAYLSVTRIVGGGVAFTTGLDVDLVLAIARTGGLAIAASVSAFLLLRRRGSWATALAWSLVVFAVLHPTTQPWYLTWGLMLLAATSAGERNRLLVGGCAVAVFVVLPIGPQLGLVVLDTTGRLALALGAAVLVALTISPAPGGPRRPRPRPDLQPDLVSIIVPTRHEADNVGPLVEEIDRVAQVARPFGSRRVEVLFVDDSDDHTPAVVESLIAQRRTSEVRIRLLHRDRSQRWGGLGGAVADGLAEVGGTVTVVMDGDLQHPPLVAAELVAEIDDGAGVAVASRRMAGGDSGHGLTRNRRWLSAGAGRLSQILFPRSVGRLSDPMSGFFALRTGAIDVNRLSPDGFKILVETVATHPDLSVREVPFRFAGRTQGLSKASASEGLRFLGHLSDLRVRTTAPWAGAPVTARLFRGV